MAGRTAYRPTPKDFRTVRAMIGYGIPQEDIARVVGCTIGVFRSRFRKEIHVGTTEVNAAVAQSMYTMAVGRLAQPAEPGDTSKGIEPRAAQPAILPQQPAAAFWLARRAGWKEPALGAKGGPPDRDAELARLIKAGITGLAPGELNPIAILQLAFVSAIEVGDVDRAIAAAGQWAPYVHAKPLPVGGGASTEPVTVEGGLPKAPLPDPEPPDTPPS